MMAKGWVITIAVVLISGAIGSGVAWVIDAHNAKERLVVSQKLNQDFAATQIENEAEIKRLQQDSRTWEELYTKINGNFDQKMNQLRTELNQEQRQLQARSEQQLRELMDAYENDQASREWSAVDLPGPVAHFMQLKADQAAGVH